MPFEVNGIAIDCIVIKSGEDFLAAALDAEPGSIIEAPPLIYMKLTSPRHRDRTDVIELIKSGLDVDACRRYLSQHAPALVEELESAVARARAEEE